MHDQVVADGIEQLSATCHILLLYLAIMSVLVFLNLNILLFVLLLSLIDGYIEAHLCHLSHSCSTLLLSLTPLLNECITERALAIVDIITQFGSVLGDLTHLCLLHPHQLNRFLRRSKLCVLLVVKVYLVVLHLIFHQLVPKCRASKGSNCEAIGGISATRAR